MSNILGFGFLLTVIAACSADKSNGDTAATDDENGMEGEYGSWDRTEDFASGYIDITSYDDPGTATEPWELRVETLYGVAWSSFDVADEHLRQNVMVNSWALGCDDVDPMSTDVIPEDAAQVNIGWQTDYWPSVDVNFNDGSWVGGVGHSFSDDYLGEELTIDGLNLEEVEQLSGGDVVEAHVRVEFFDSSSVDLDVDVNFHITHCGQIDW